MDFHSCLERGPNMHCSSELWSLVQSISMWKWKCSLRRLENTVPTAHVQQIHGPWRIWVEINCLEELSEWYQSEYWPGWDGKTQTNMIIIGQLCESEFHLLDYFIDDWIFKLITVSKQLESCNWFNLYEKSLFGWTMRCTGRFLVWHTRTVYFPFC